MYSLCCRGSRRALRAASILFLASTTAIAQETGVIRGRVTDASGRALTDAQVSVVGTSLGTVSGASGEYTLVAVPSGSRLVQARRIGYARRMQSVDVPSGGDARIDFQLTVAASQLDAVVVTGTAGAVEKRTVGNAVTQIDASDVTRQTNVSNVMEILQARSPGVQIQAGSGTPGTASDIRIRGASSLTVTRPVVYIDGIRISTAGLGNFDPSGQGLSGNSGGQGANAWDLVDPSSIESIEIIKGPAASTLYGADAAGGVIQIITKKGSRGQQQAQWGARVEAGRSDLNSVEFPVNYTWCNTLRDTLTVANPAGPVPARVIAYPGCQGKLNQVLTQSPLRDLPGAVRDGAIHSYDLHVRGGVDRFSYYVSAAHDEEGGVFYNSYDRRRSLRSNFGFAASPKIDLQVNAGVTDGHVRFPLDGESAQGLLFSALRGIPGRVSTLPGQPIQGWATVTPEQSNQYDNQTRTQRVLIGTTATYQPFAWLRNRLTAGLDWNNGQATLLAPPNAPVLTGDTLGLSALRMPRSALYTLDYSGTADYKVNPSLASSTSFGSQVVASRSEALVATGRGLGSPDVTLIGSTTTITAANSFSANNSVGYYVQEQLAWKNRMYGTVALRADDNSSFGTDFNIITYPKASLSWILSEEPALQSLFQTLRAQNFKFRTAWGQAGRAPDPFSATRTYTISVVTNGSGTASAIRTSAFGNPGLKPERGSELEVGFESDFFDGRAGADFTYYNKKMNDVLVSTAVAPSSGFRGAQQANIGKTLNSGIELALAGTPVQRDRFGWEMRVAFSTNHNKLLSFGDTTIKQIVPFQSYGSVQQHRVGYPLGGYWAPFPKRNPDGTLVLVNGAIVFDSVGSSFDRVNQYIGPAMPTREIAFANNVSIGRSVRIYALLDYKGGFYNYRGVDLYRCAASQNCIQLNDPNFPVAELPIYQAGVSAAPRGIYIHKADFTKLRDVSVSYALPRSVAGRANMSAAEIMLAGHNLAIWSNYPGPDPEVNTYGRQNAVTGLFNRGDIYAMPMSRRLTATLNLTF